VAWKQFGPEPQPTRANQSSNQSAVPSTVGRMGSEGFWVGDYGGVWVGRSFSARRIGPVRGLAP
jgi:hypothetical protein